MSQWCMQQTSSPLTIERMSIISFSSPRRGTSRVLGDRSRGHTKDQVQLPVGEGCMRENRMVMMMQAVAYAVKFAVL
jgi:hypothetical protein